MSVYYNPATNNDLNITEMDLPKFAKKFLNYLLIELNLAPRTIFNYSVSITSFFRWVVYTEHPVPLDDFSKISVKELAPEQIASMTRSDIFDFMAFCHDRLHNNDRARAAKLSAIRHLYEYLSSKSDYTDIFKTNPAKDIAPGKKEKSLPIYMSYDEVMALLAAIDNKHTGKRDYCMIFWLVSCGMRLSELVAIDLTDIKNDSIRIFGKGRKERIIPLNESCLGALDEYLAERACYPRLNDQNALFISPQTGNRITGRRVEQVLEGYLKKAGLSGNKFSPHKLRHTTATMLYQSSTAGILEIRDLLGHEDTSTTELYTHLSPDSTKNVMQHSPLNKIYRAENKDGVTENFSKKGHHT